MKTILLTITAISTLAASAFAGNYTISEAPNPANPATIVTSIKDTTNGTITTIAKNGNQYSVIDPQNRLTFHFSVNGLVDGYTYN